MSLRTLIVVTSLDLAVGGRLLLPLGAFALTGALYCLFLFRRDRKPGASESAPFSNPFELGPALKFGLMFMLILTLSRAAQYWFGNVGTYISSLAAGLMDVDAVSFSMTRLSGTLGAETAANAVLLAVLSNSVLKGMFAMISGSRDLRRAIMPGFALMVAVGCAAAWIRTG
jgi:uncharacterized membrane protein (DUF4010 family)